MVYLLDINNVMVEVLKRVLKKEIEHQKEMLLEDNKNNLSNLIDTRYYIISECLFIIQKLEYDERNK